MSKKKKDLQDFASLLQILRICSQLTAIFCHVAPFSPTSTFTLKYTLPRNFSHHMNALSLIPRYDRPKEGGKQKISLQVV